MWLFGTMQSGHESNISSYKHERRIRKCYKNVTKQSQQFFIKDQIISVTGFPRHTSVYAAEHGDKKKSKQTLYLDDQVWLSSSISEVTVKC